jgi:hypothetical protein
MLNTHFGTEESQTLWARNSLICMSWMILKVQRHNAQLITPRQEMEMCWILWSIGIVSDILDSGHLPIVVHILDQVRTTKFSESTEKFKNWERFQSLVSDLISPRIEINSGVEADKAARLYSFCRFGVQVIGQ